MKCAADGHLPLMTNIDRDIPFCGGNCLQDEPSIPAMVESSFSNSSDFQAVVVPSAGHGLNLVSQPRPSR